MLQPGHFRRNPQCASRAPWPGRRWPALPRAGMRPSCRCFRPGGRARRRISASAQAMTSPGNPPPEPRSAQIRASGASARSWSESATWRVHSVGFGRGCDQIHSLLPGAAAWPRSGRAGAVFHVKQGSAPGHGRGQPTGPLGVQNAGAMARDAGHQAVRGARPVHAAPRLALRSCRRICATSKVSAAGVMPSIRPAWPIVRGRCACSLWRTSFDRPGSVA